MTVQEQLVIPASRVKAVWLLLGSVGFVALGYFLTGSHPIEGWLCVGFFGLGIPVSLFMLFSNGIYMKLTPQGIESSSMFKRRTVIRWRDVAGFQIGSIQGARMIQIIYQPSYTEQAALRKVVSAMSGMEGAIGNAYTVPLDKLVVVLNEWHARYGAAGSV